LRYLSPLFIIISAVLLSTPASAITADDWKLLTEDSQHAYIAGIVDTWNRLYILSDLATNHSPQYRPSQAELTFVALGRCISTKRIPYVEVTAAVRSYIQGHSEESSNDMAVITFGAMSQTCNNERR
jgi:hypothetical protein